MLSNMKELTYYMIEARNVTTNPFKTFIYTLENVIQHFLKEKFYQRTIKFLSAWWIVKFHIENGLLVESLFSSLKPQKIWEACHLLNDSYLIKTGFQIYILGFCNKILLFWCIELNTREREWERRPLCTFEVSISLSE